MQINLRKADAVARAMLAEAGAIRDIPSITLSYLDFPHEESIKRAIEEAKSRAAEVVIRRSQFINHAYLIRMDKGQAMAKAGINTLLTERASIESKISKLPPHEEPVDIDELALSIHRRFEAHRKGKEGEDYTMRSLLGSQTVSLKDAVNSKELLLGYKRRLIAINDELIALNISTTITLAESAVKLATEIGVL